MTDMAIPATRSLDIGRVLSKAFPIFARHWGVFFLTNLVYWAVAFAVGVAGTVAIAALRGPASAAPNVAAGALAVVLVCVEVAALLLQFGFVQSVVSFVCGADIRGGKPSFGACMSEGVAHMLQVTIIIVLRAICEVIGYILFIIPGVFLAVIWSMAVPADAIDKAGVFGAFSRSADVTQGHRWSVFGLILVVRVINSVALTVAYIFGFAVLIVPLAATGLLANHPNMAPTADVGAGLGVILVGSIIYFVIVTLFLSVNAAITAASYLELAPASEVAPSLEVLSGI